MYTKLNILQLNQFINSNFVKLRLRFFLTATFSRLHASSLVPKHNVRSLAARRLIRMVTNILVTLSRPAFGKYLLHPAFILRFFNTRVPGVAAAQTSFRPRVVRRLLVLLQKTARAHASLPRQALAVGQIRPGQNVHSVEVVSTAHAISLQRSGQHVHPVELTDTPAAISLQRPGDHVHPVELADAHSAVTLPGSRRTVELTDAHPSVSYGRLGRLGSVRLAHAGLSFA